MNIQYNKDKWLVDSASTCMVANEPFNEFYNIRPADVTITVGGDHQLACTRVGDLIVKTKTGPLDFPSIRIVPGFGVNILSDPYLSRSWA